MKNHFRQAMDAHGLTVKEVAHLGIPYQTVYKHYNGKRKVTADYALLYDEKAGLPKEEVRPDIWPENTVPDNNEKGHENVTQRI